MAANDYQYARTPKPSDIGVAVYGGTAITTGLCVTLDTGNLMPTKPIIGVQRSTTDDNILGVAVENIAASGGQGRVACGDGDIVQCVASGAITAGTYVQAGANGKVATAGAAKPLVGLALTTTTADNDLILVMLRISKNA
jgi:hypothetical protein